jgi:hypothetical protein
MKEEEKLKDISPPDLKISSALHTVAASAEKLERKKQQGVLTKKETSTEAPLQLPHRQDPYLRTEKRRFMIRHNASRTESRHNYNGRSTISQESPTALNPRNRKSEDSQAEPSENPGENDNAQSSDKNQCPRGRVYRPGTSPPHSGGKVPAKKQECQRDRPRSFQVQHQEQDGNGTCSRQIKSGREEKNMLRRPIFEAGFLLGLGFLQATKDAQSLVGDSDHLRQPGGNSQAHTKEV